MNAEILIVDDNSDIRNILNELIRDSGCAGMKVGNAYISEKHSNFFVNNGSAKSDDLEIASKAAESAGLNMQELQSEFDNNGTLNEKSYEALNKAGIPKEYVDQFIAGQLAMRDNMVNDVKGIAGGDTGYQDMVAWAAENLSDAEKAAYNNAVNSADMEGIKLAVNGLKARYESANGVEPTLAKGKASPSTEGGFRSWAEVTAAMNDPRYSKDIAYQDDVKRKIKNSNL